jgi:hypothetical protein
LQDLQAFAATMGPLSVTYVCKNLCYILLQVRGSGSLAAVCGWFVLVTKLTLGAITCFALAWARARLQQTQ